MGLFTQGNRRVSAAILLAALSGCSPAEDVGSGEGAEVPSSDVMSELRRLPTDPASWVGALPCADCEGTRSTLTLWSEGRYLRSDAYVGTASSEDGLSTSSGRWFWEGRERAVLVVISESDELRRFERLADGGLGALDVEGEGGASGTSFRLNPVADPVHEGRIEVLGGFSYFADAALLVTCASGMQYSVAMEAGYLALERAYGAAGFRGLAPMLVRVTGRLAQRPAMDGPGTETVLVVDEHAAADGRCRSLELPAALAESWELTHLDGERVPASVPPITFTLDPDVAELSGSAGCNRFSGRGVLRGALLVSGPLAATRRFCEGVMELEDRVLQVLGTGGWLRRDGETLVLRHGPHEAARFEMLRDGG